MAGKIFALLAALLLAAGCAGTGRTLNEDGYEELTPKEKTVLVERARTIIEADKNELQGKQLAYVKSNEPQFKLSYRGDCYGRAIITWRIDFEKKTFRVVFTGKLNSDDPDELVARYSVLRETEQQTVQDTGATLRPDINITRKEWQDLRKR
ncbi:MAG: hypothetical protein PHI85_10200 [Victivallaceae bacterium]|nr:hypothetical protein [Victivallaceae bacterium]